MAAAKAVGELAKGRGGGDDRAREYTSVADDSGSSEKQRQASMLFSVAEKAMNDEDLDECLRASADALLLFKELGAGGLKGIHDTLRLQVTAHRMKADQQKRKPEEALKIAEEELQRFVSQGDKRGEASMLLSVAEINCDKRGRRKRGEALQSVTKALLLFREVGDRKGEAMAHVVMGNVSFKLYNSEDVSQANDTALEIFTEIGDKLGMAKALHGKGISYLMNRKFDKAVEKAREALEIFRELGYRRLEASELVSIAQWHLASEKPKKALPPAEQALSIFKELKYGKGWEAMALFTCCEALIGSKQARSAMKLAKEYQERYEEAKDLRGQAIVQEVMARIHLAQESPDKALESVDQARKIVREMGDKRWDARLCHGEAVSHLASKDHRDAIAALEKGLQLAQVANDRKEETHCHRTICEILMSKQDFQGALRAAQAAKALAQQSTDRKGEAGDCVQISVALANSGQLDKALKSIDTAQKLFQELCDTRGEARALAVLAELRLMEGRVEGALEAAEERLTIVRELGDLKLEGAALHQITSLHMQDENPAEAEKVAKEARSLYHKVGDAKGEVDVLLTLLQIYLGQVQEPSSIGSKPIIERALKAAADAVAVAGKSGDKGLRASALFGRAQVLMMADRYHDALRLAQDAATIFGVVRSVQGEARASVLVASLQNAFGFREKAKTICLRAIELAKTCNDKQALDDGNTVLRRIEAAIAAAVPPKVEEVQIVPQVEVQQATTQAAPVASVAAPPAKQGLDPVYVRKQLMAYVKDVMSTDDELELDSPFMEAGMDSLSSVSLMSMVAKEFQMALSPSLVFDFPTVRALEEHLVAESQSAL